MLCDTRLAHWTDLREKYGKVQRRTQVNSFVSEQLPRETPEELGAAQIWSWDAQLTKKRWPLFRLVPMYRTLRCSNVRDRIYAFRELAEDQDDIIADYSKPALFIYF